MIDLITVIPLTYFIDTSSTNGLARIARLPRLYKLIRLMKLIRMLKMLRERSKIVLYLNEVLKLKPAAERLIIFFCVSLLFTHTMACLWYFLAKLD
jgi:hyperpolarization activated cyclic nucleotide-gated potassium channel 1